MPLLDLFGGEYEGEEDPYSQGPYPRRHISGVSPEVAAETIKRLRPEIEGKSVGGFAKNLIRDVGEVGAAFATLLGYPLYQPRKTAKAIAGAAKAVYEKPVETAKAVGEALVEPYRPGPGETFIEHLGERAYTHPFTTAADAAFLVEGPLSAAAGAARLAGAGRTAAALSHVAKGAGRAIDPIAQTARVGKWAFRTKTPDAYAAYVTKKGLADAAAVETARIRFHTDEIKRRLYGPEGIMADLNDAERAVFFPYAEGRFYIDELGPREMTYRGIIEPHSADMPIRKEALDQALQRYQPTLDEMDKLMGYDQASVVSKRLENEVRKRTKADPNFNPFEGGFQQEMDALRQQTIQEWEAAKLNRNTVSMRTALDVKKETDWKAAVEKIKMENEEMRLLDEASILPRPKATTPEEALALMGPQGGVYVPHSTEVLTRDQSTIGNILTKFREATPWKHNEGAMFRSGQLEHMNAANAITRTYVRLQGRQSFPRMAQESVERLVADGLATKVEKGYLPHTDPDLRAGTHQLFEPHLVWRDSMATSEGQRLITRLLEVADDERSVQQLLATDIAEGVTKGFDELFPRAKPDIYKVPTEVGRALRQWRDSFEPTTNPFVNFLDGVSDRWNFMNLNLRGTRMINNVFGNMDFAAMHGVHPFSVDGFWAFVDAGRGWAYRAERHPERMSETAKRLAQVYELPGVAQGGFAGASEAMLGASRYSTKLMKSKNPLSRMVGRAGDFMQRTNTEIEDFFRAATTIFDIRKQAGARAVEFNTNVNRATAALEEIDRLRRLGANAIDDATLKSGLGFTNKVLNNYDRTSAIERNIVRRVAPYHKFYQHAVGMFFHHPFERAVKNKAMRQIGNMALEDVKTTLKSWGFDWDQLVPDYLRDSVPMYQTTGPDGSPVAVLVSTKGPNPFGFASMSDPSEEGLSMLHPLAKAAIEFTFGLNLFTGEKFRGSVSAFQGKEFDAEGRLTQVTQRPNPVDQFLKQFWPYQSIRDMVAAGRVPHDTTSLLDMLMDSPEAWDIDKRGYPRRRPIPHPRLRPALRLIGPAPQVLETPTQEQERTRKSTANSQLTDLAQRHPEFFERIVEEIQKVAANYEYTPRPRPRMY